MPKKPKKDKKNKKEVLDKEADITKDETVDDKQENNKSKKGLIIFLLILFLVLGTIISIIFFNVFGIRDKYLSNVPVIKNINYNSTQTTESKNSKTTEELELEIASLQKELDKANADLKEAQDTILADQAQIATLTQYQDQQLAFKEEKKQFDTMIAMNDPAAYSTFYETINPENADALYQEAKQSAEDQAAVDKYIADFQNMDPKSAAAILEQLMLTDMDLVVMILDGMTSVQTADILSEMSPANAATVSKMLAP